MLLLKYQLKHFFINIWSPCFWSIQSTYMLCMLGNSGVIDGKGLLTFFYTSSQASLVAQMVKCLPTMQETRVQSLGQEGPLEKEMATHSSILVWRIPWTEEPGELQSMGSQRVWHYWATSLYTSSPFVLCAGLSRSVKSVFATPWTAAHQAPLSMEILQVRILELSCHALLQGVFPAQGWSPGLYKQNTVSFVSQVAQW